MTKLLGQGIYTFRDAVRLTGLKASRVREWFRRRPVFQGDYEPVDGDFAISFYDLVDVFVAGQLREHGVTLQTVRKVYHRMAEDLATKHPFCRKELLTDGKKVFLKNVSAIGEPELVEVLTKQGVFTDFILPFLRTIDYDKVGFLARRWRIAESVVIDPQICFGSPIVEAAGIPTAVLAEAYLANQNDASLIADWYGVAQESVLAAAAFERKLAA